RQSSTVVVASQPRQELYRRSPSPTSASRALTKGGFPMSNPTKPRPTRSFSKFLAATSLAALLLCLSAPVFAHDDDDDHHHGRRHDHHGSPKVVLISLDGAKPEFIQKFIDQGVLPRDGGLAQLSRGVVARQNVTATPSLTAVSHIAIATGSTSVHNDIP